jgi:hypothetical protein
MSFNLYASPRERDALIAGLYDLAIFLEDHPGTPAPHMITIHVFPPTGMADTESRAEIDAIAALTGAEISVSASGHYAASLYFGPVEYKFVAIPHGTGNGESE